MNDRNEVTGHEKLIEEARAFGEAERIQGHTLTADRYIRLSDALEAAERAHTPTDDEREGWGVRTRMIHVISRIRSYDVFAIADAPTSQPSPQVDITSQLDAIDTAANIDALRSVWVAIDAAGLGKHPELWAAKEARKKELE